MEAQLQYNRPKTLDCALEALASEAYTIAAGCTDLFPATERKVLPGPILDITAIPELRGVDIRKDGVWIGATTTWRDIIDANLPPAFDGLKAAAREVGARQIQNRGTIAGNLCNASPAADGVPPLLTLDAQVLLASQTGTRHLPLSKFLQGPRKTDRTSAELVKGLFVPKDASGGQGAFLKLGARKYLVISIAMCAARLEVADGIIRQAALAVGSCGPVAMRLTQVEDAIVGFPLRDAKISAEMLQPYLAPIDDVRATASYRAEASMHVLNDMLAEFQRMQA